jgi:GalNAc-alpha-(1->4)-GalNAc-alpha-(1->3)-diNAcBac-PP-undecaprenol alpha-1,4-N-acetyl-D-galactosaminyltransferase
VRLRSQGCAPGRGSPAELEWPFATFTPILSLADQIRLLFVIKTMVAPGGGAERVLAELTGELARRGHSVSVAYFDEPDARPFYDFADSVRLIPVDIGSVERKSGVGEVARRIAALRRLARGDRPDVAIGFMHSAFVPLAAALAGTSIPALASEHTVFEHYRPRPLERASIMVAAPFLGGITVISDRVRDGFPRFLRRKMHVISNPVLRPGAIADVIGGPVRTILSVGRLEPEKDQPTLIEAFAQVAGRFPEWNLRIVGEGSLRSSLEAQLGSLGLVGRVQLPGAVRDISSEYSSAQLFVLASLYESFGLATAEAMAHGLPAIGFADCPGTNELIHHGVNGLLVAGTDRARALADGLDQLMSSDEQRGRLALAAPKSVAPFALEAIVDQWELLLRELV